MFLGNLLSHGQAQARSFVPFVGIKILEEFFPGFPLNTGSVVYHPEPDTPAGRLVR